MINLIRRNYASNIKPLLYYKLLLPSLLNNSSHIPIHFAINEKELKKNYHFYQRQYHPDHLSQQSENKNDDFDISQKNEDKSQVINTAYNTLKDPLKRSEYLLSNLINGSHVKDEVISNDDFLLQVMSIREEIEESDTVEQIYPLCKNVEQMSGGLIKQLEREMDCILSALRQNEQDKSINRRVEAINGILAKLRYLKRIEDQCKEMDCC